jgi:hypothetical protein
LPIDQFGHHLLETHDLDPIYTGLKNVQWSEDQLHRWLVAYWCFYHAGAACWLSESKGEHFWTAMRKAAENVSPAPNGGRWPRGSERRHFRGQQGIAAVLDLQERYGDAPEDMVGYIIGPYRAPEPLPFQVVAERAKEHRAFGPWIAFKVADMMDRVVGVPVDFDKAAIFMFDDPITGALMLWRKMALKLPDTELRHSTIMPKKFDDTIEYVVMYLKDKFRSYDAPPTGDRKVNLQEIETILCKWKSHMSGHYPLYNDIDEIHYGLDDWMDTCSTVREFKQALPRRKS